MIDERVTSLLDKLGQNADQEFDVIGELNKLAVRLPSVLLHRYRTEKKWQTRRSCVYHAIGYSKDDNDAVQLGIEALSDKSKVVRYQACLLLSFSLKKEVLPELQKVKQTISDNETLANVEAAIDAIEHQNTNFFADRQHTGKITLKITKIPEPLKTR
jgi:hypothetical protein